MGAIQANHDWDWSVAEASYRKALDFEPGNAEALRRLGNLTCNLGKWDEAIDLERKSIERDPLRSNSYNNLGLCLLAADRDAEAVTALVRALEIDPDGASRHVQLGHALLVQGKTDAALREIQQESEEAWRLYGLALVHHSRDRRVESDAALQELKAKYSADAAYQIASVHAWRGEKDQAFEWLDRAYAQRDPGTSEIKGDRTMRPIMRDPRYKAFLAKLKLPE